MAVRRPDLERLHATARNLVDLIETGDLNEIVRHLDEWDDDGYGPGGTAGSRSSSPSDPTARAALRPTTLNYRRILDEANLWLTRAAAAIATAKRPPTADMVERITTHEAETNSGAGTCAACGRTCTGERNIPGQQDDRIKAIGRHLLCPTHYQQCRRRARNLRLDPADHVDDYVESTRNIYGTGLSVGVTDDPQ